MDELFSFRALLIFVLTTLADILWAIYIRRVGEGKAMQSATTSALLWLLAAFVIINYVENKWLIAPGVLGAFVGTYFTVKWDHGKKVS
jgi:hypothetical protein